MRQTWDQESFQNAKRNGWSAQIIAEDLLQGGAACLAVDDWEHRRPSRAGG